MILFKGCPNAFGQTNKTHIAKWLAAGASIGSRGREIAMVEKTKEEHRNVRNHYQAVA
jgi:hypothetical protein